MLYELGLLATFAACLWVLVDLLGARGPVRLRVPFVVLLGGIALLAVGALVQQRAEAPGQILLGRRLFHLGLNTAAVSFVWTGAVTARAAWYRRRPWLVALAALPLLVIYSFLYWDTAARFVHWTAVPPQRGPVFWVQAVYDWSLVVVGASHFLLAARRLGKGHPVRLAALALVGVVILVASFSYLLGGAAHDPTPIVLGASAVVLRLAVLDSGLAALLPLSQRGVFEQLRTAVMVADLEGVVIDANPAAHALLGGETLLGRRLEDLVAAVRSDPERVIEVEQVPLRSRFGKAGFAALFTDRTPAARLEQQFREVQRFESLGVMAGGVAHDFNNLLTAIIANLGVARKALEGNPARRRAEDAIRTAMLASDLADQLLAYAGQGKFQVRPLDLSDEIARMHGLLRSSIPKRVRLVTKLAEGLPIIEADVIEMSQLLLNLARNAADSIEAQGSVSIRTWLQEVGEEERRDLVPGSRVENGPHVVLEVQDDGCGMDEETRRRIFEPFFTTKPSGHGLGLAAALGIAHGHGAGVTVDSEPGEGTRFRVFFPVAAGLGRSTPEPMVAASSGR